MTDKTFIDIVFDGPPDQNAPRFIEVHNANGRSIHAGEWVKITVDGVGYHALRFYTPEVTQEMIDRGAIALCVESGFLNPNEIIATIGGGKTERWKTYRSRAEQVLEAAFTGIRTFDFGHNAAWEGANRAYLDVVIQGRAVANSDRNDIGDRRAVSAFIERFEARAALAIPATSKG
jgi:hypothetical protein